MAGRLIFVGRPNELRQRCRRRRLWRGRLNRLGWLGRLHLHLAGCLWLGLLHGQGLVPITHQRRKRLKNAHFCASLSIEKRQFCLTVGSPEAHRFCARAHRELTGLSFMCLQGKVLNFGDPQRGLTGLQAVRSPCAHRTNFFGLIGGSSVYFGGSSEAHRLN